MKGKNNFMELQKKPYLQGEINKIQCICEKLRWLAPYIDDAPNVVHFGCSSGLQTIALAWKFNSSEVIGLDIKRNSIRQARTDLLNLQKDLTEIKRHIGDAWVLPCDRDWWSRMDDFFKRHLISKECEIIFEVQDITLPTSLCKNHYDLAFTDYALYQIWFAEGGPRVSCKTKFAVGEMVRVVQPGGYVAAREPIRHHEDGRTLDYRTLFEQFNLTQVHIEENGKTVEYIYSKGI